ncbi:MAG: ATP-binding protein, partial [Faecousia sp.]
MLGTLKEAAAFNAVLGKLNEKDGIDCPICGNKGVVYRVDDDGCLFASECECMAKRKSLRLLRRSGLEDMIREKTFKAFTTPDEFTTRAKRTAVDYVNHGENKWFYISGHPGCGKTHLCTAICRRFLSENIPVRYFLWREDGPKLKTMVNSDAEGYAKLFNEFANAPVLYIDDFLKGKVTEADMNLTFALINARYNRSRKTRTIFSSERSIAELRKLDESLGGRVYERAGDGLYVLNAPPDAINW